VKIVEIADPPAAEALVARFAAAPLPFVLDSAQRNDGLGEWSFFGAEPYARVAGSLADLREAMRGYTAAGAEIPFTGGAVGYIAYDYGRRLEQLPNLAHDDRAIPDLQFHLYAGVAAFHHPSKRLYLSGHDVGGESAEAVIARLRQRIESRPPEIAPPARRSAWEWNMSREDFCQAVRTIRAYIASGDVYQVNLSRRAECRYEGDPIGLYAALRGGNPAPYGWYLFSTSPEQFLRKRGRAVETRPIKGTRPRGSDEAVNRAQERALQASEKDRAELLMIVDLERNDLGRVAEFGSVCVDGLYNLERYARVVHQTARVKARLAEGRDVFDALAALFPGGSITGAPKIRAMEIIESLEPTRRGAYCGSVGYVGFDGDADFNIAIRSLHLKDGRLDYQVGGGIVWDSDPEAEFAETLDKARAIRESIDELCRKSP
jgi:para-aminobenzoate synthetase component 1